MHRARASVAALTGVLLTPAGLANADEITIGTACGGEDLNSTIVTSGGTTLRCVADGVHQGFHWEADGEAIKALADLESQGYTIHLQKVGVSPIDQCQVTAIEDYQTSTVTQGNTSSTVGPETATIQITKSVTVALDCEQ